MIVVEDGMGQEGRLPRRNRWRVNLPHQLIRRELRDAVMIEYLPKLSHVLHRRGLVERDTDGRLIQTAHIDLVGGGNSDEVRRRAIGQPDSQGVKERAVRQLVAEAAQAR